jgi:hypothetical protein
MASNIMNNNKPGQYVIANERQRQVINPGQYHKQYVTSTDHHYVAEQLKRFTQRNDILNTNNYTARGKGSRWIRINTKRATVLYSGAVIIDINKLLTIGKTYDRHASTMHKAAHKIKVNAFKSALVTGDK